MGTRWQGAATGVSVLCQMPDARRTDNARQHTLDRQRANLARSGALCVFAVFECVLVFFVFLFVIMGFVLHFSNFW